MHRYYAHVLGSVLSHNPFYDQYRIRHPFPPYATHYFSLLLLHKVFSYDFAEKVFTCGLVVCFGYGFRFCAMAIGPFGDLVSLCIAPLFLHWAVMMGFFNYDLALAFFLFAVGFWVRAAAARRRFWLGYVAMVLLLAVTHPVPLLILVGLCAVDLLLNLLRPERLATNGFFQRNGWRLAALAFACLTFLYPAASVDSAHSFSALHNIALHKEFVKTALMLTGVSPYNTRSTSLLMNFHRLSLYLLLAGFLFLGGRAFASAWKSHKLTHGDSVFLSTVLLGLSLPFLPDGVNGSFYFSTRLVVLLWIGSMLAASGYVPRRDRSARLLIPIGVLFSLIALVTAEVYIRPVARIVDTVQQQPLPQQQDGLLLVGKELDSWSRFTFQLAPNFFEWGAVLPFVRQEDIALDSPWLEQNILPLQAMAESPLMIDTRKVDYLKANHGEGGPRTSAPDPDVLRTLRAASFIMYAGTQHELASGLLGQLAPREAARFRCSQHGWYLLCLAGPRS